ncbi:unnamed protein product [Gadus morhua 'NCC']
MSQHVEWKQTGTHLTRHTDPLLGRLHPRPCPTLDPVSSPEPVPLRTRPHSEPGPTPDPAPLLTRPHSRPGPTSGPAQLRTPTLRTRPYSRPGPTFSCLELCHARDLVSASPDPSPFLC